MDDFKREDAINCMTFILTLGSGLLFSLGINEHLQLPELAADLLVLLSIALFTIAAIGLFSCNNSLVINIIIFSTLTLCAVCFAIYYKSPFGIFNDSFLYYAIYNIGVAALLIFIYSPMTQIILDLIFILKQ